MKSLFFKNKQGQRKVNWGITIGYVVLIYAAFLGVSQGLCWAIAGETNPTVGLVAMVLATLFLIRVVGSMLANPYTHDDPKLTSS